MTSRRTLAAVLVTVSWSVALAVRVSGVQTPAASPAQTTPDQLARQVFGIFQKSCIECHGAGRDGGLDLRTDAGLQKGGGRGQVVIAHEPVQSRLYKAVMHEGPLQMPQDADQLSETDRELIRQWIVAGASLAAVPEANPSADAALDDLKKREERPITAAERESWAFKVPVKPAVPRVASIVSAPVKRGWTSNPIDAFLLSAMTSKSLTPAPPADKRALVRRLYLDVLGLPPTAAEIDAFVRDRTPNAWPALVDKLLASPHYGERWARHWMDLVRYADSGGFEFDVDRPEMYRYRDYLVDSFNRDKPYDVFVKEQIAGDEIGPTSDEAMIATGYLRLGTEGGNRLDQVDDLVTTTSLTFMGVTVGCARCHNHKFDPIPQKDYYRMQSVFFSTRAVEHPLVSAAEVAKNKAETDRIDALLRPVRERKTAIEKPYHQQIVDREVAKLPDYMQAAWKTPAAQRTDGQRLNAKQIEDTLGINSLRKLVTEKDVVALMPDDVKAKHAAVKAEIAALDAEKPKRLPTARAIGERARTPQTSYFLHRGSADARGSVMMPGVLSVASPTEWNFPEPPADATSSYRRKGFSEWLVSKSNPLTARVMVNRLWQHHFGEGIVRTPSNFGKMGEAPSHPALLDWLAVEFMDRGWSLKAMHRLMLTSEAYKMSTSDVQHNIDIDPENRMFWRMPRVRLDVEAIRDSILATAGTLNRTVGGPSVFPYIDPDLFEKSSNRDWRGKPDSDPATWRRSLYVFSKRSIRYPMFETFDQPNLINSTDRRNRTTIAPQALILMNNPMVIFQAGKFAERIAKEAGPDVNAQVRLALSTALGRPATLPEVQRGAAFIKEGGVSGLSDYCHLLFNLNEFVYRP